MQNSPSPRTQEPHSSEFMKKICDQIQAQVQTLLGTLSSEDVSQMSGKLLQKCIISTRNSIMRVVQVRLPQLAAIEQKLKSLIVGIDDQLQAQKEKTKQMLAKYEQKILECDRYKMETVSVGQMYEALLQQHVELQARIQQKSNQKHKYKEIVDSQQFGTQTDHTQYKLVLVEDFIRLGQRLEQSKQQKQLFYAELVKNNDAISQMRANEAASNQRIEQLIEQISRLNQQVQAQKERAQAVRDEMGEEILALELRNEGVRGQLGVLQKLRQQQKQQGQQQIRKMQQKHQAEVAQIVSIAEIKAKQIDSLQSQLSNKQTQIKQLNLNLKLNSQSLFASTQQVLMLQSQLKHSNTLVQELQHQIHALQLKADKIDALAAMKQTLQHKYSQKCEVLARQNKQSANKCKHLQHENERLYQAMDQYAGKEMKLVTRIKALQAKLQGCQQERARYVGRRQVAMVKVQKLVKQVECLRQHIKGKVNTSIASLVKSFLSSAIELLQQFQAKLHKKLSQLSSHNSQQRQQYSLRISLLQKQLIMTQQKHLQSQLNLNKITNSLLASKNDIYIQISTKEATIQDLQRELARERQINQTTARNLAQVIAKYEGSRLLLNTNSSNRQASRNENYADLVQDQQQLHRKMVQQRNRAYKIQAEYKALLRP